jgi:multisubunit Na+/H+ antiporter MnhC subunit
MATMLSIMVLAAIALVAGGIYLWRRDGMRKQAALMLAAAAVIAVNIAILTVPNSDGSSPLAQTPR